MQRAVRVGEPRTYTRRARGTYRLKILSTGLLEVCNLVEQALEIPLFLGLRIASVSLRRDERGWARKTYDARVHLVEVRVVSAT